MLITLAEFENDLGKYLNLAGTEEIFVAKNDNSVIKISNVNFTERERIREEKRSQVNIALKDACNRIKNIFGDDLEKIILFGSYARGDFREHSDVDIMVLVKCGNEKINDLKNQVIQIDVYLLNEYDVFFQTMVFNIDYFNEWKNAMPLFANVAEEGILVNG